MKEIVSEKALSQEISRSSAKVIVLDFYAPWCGPCKMLGPVLDKMQSKYQNTLFLKINTDEDSLSNLTSQYNVSALPTVVILVKSGAHLTKVATIKGYQPDAIEAEIRKHV